ncbi:MAG: glycosyltransferase family 2 protein [Methylobacter sp.]|uniref:glycosyltransferase family 2 protein n=1 Tax=Methylobacter sp. TaxID=2051955 RepID=UPI002585198D|nr:glycosyltransferase family 2 protein [Methylobacter sp.]MCL7420691.1 glycosyltransferase family 2 protein [Methylobacter sp.]
MSLISVIITTYNWPEALAASLQSLLSQEDRNFEILVADDGSTDATAKLITNRYASSSIPIQHIRHDDQGFRAGTIRNKAVARSQGDYLIFIDGDCIVFPDFIKNHRHLATKDHFVPGNRILLTESFTREVLNENISLYNQSITYFISQWFTNKINRITPLIRLPLGPLRLTQPSRWQKAMTCNLAIWKNDFVGVNGFDELFEGWGYEDSDLVIRLIHNGVRRKEGRFAIPVLHLWHRQNDQSRHDQNFQRLMERLHEQSFIRARKGLDQYL